MANARRTTGNVRAREYASPQQQPPKKRFNKAVVTRLIVPGGGALDATSPVSVCSTISSSRGGSQRSDDGEEGDAVGVTQGEMTTAEVEAQRENMLKMFESWYHGRSQRTPPVLTSTEVSAEVLTTVSVGNGTGAKGTWKQVWTAKCEERLPYLYEVITPGYVEAAILGPMMSVGWKNPGVNPTLNDSVLLASSWMNGLKFSKTPGTGKNSWDTEGGKLQMLFRESVIREVVRRIESDAVGLMEKIKKKREGTAEEIEGEEIPEWMGPGFIKTADVRAVLDGKIGTGSSQGRRLRTKKVEREDAARHVVKIGYEQLSKTMTSGRRRLDDGYYGKSGHLYVDWSKYPVVGSGEPTYVNQKDMICTFPKEADKILQEELSSIPEASFMDGEKSLRAVDRENSAKYRIVESKLEDLYMDVEHEGLEKENGQWERKRKTKRVDFLALALQMLLTFSFGVSKERLFRSNPSSFKRITGLACLLYTMALEYESTREEKEVDVVQNLEEVSIGPLRLSQLLPCEYRIREVIRKGGCLTW